VLWTTDPAHRVTLPSQVRAASAVDMLGDRRPLTREGGQVTLELTGSPQYVALRSGAVQP
jgi:hypothetical protein